jgi:hypothetical protein
MGDLMNAGSAFQLSFIVMNSACLLRRADTSSPRRGYWQWTTLSNNYKHPAGSTFALKKSGKKEGKAG